MHPYTFNSDDAQARALSPSSSDISVTNDLYPLIAGFSTRTVSEADGVYVHPSWSVILWFNPVDEGPGSCIIFTQNR